MTFNRWYPIRLTAFSPERRSAPHRGLLFAGSTGLLALFALSLGPAPAHAVWATNGNPASTAVENQSLPQSVSDGAGGIIVVWQDFRNDPPDPAALPVPDLSDSADVYVQRLDASGNPMWTADGVALCTDAAAQQSPVICSDGAGGAIIAWQEVRASATNYDIYVQGVTSGGTPKWTANGVLLCGATGAQVLEVIAPDDAGGAIVAWRDSRGASADVYARRISSLGIPLWTADGVPVCTAAGQQNDVRITPDQQGGAYLAWRDPRDAGTGNDIYAQAIAAADGAPRWAVDGVAVCIAAGSQILPTIAGDGRYGLLVTWQDSRNGATGNDIYAQRIRPDGTAAWPTANGVLVCGSDSSQSTPIVVSDGLAGAIIAWTDTRTSIKWPDIYAQRVDSAGAAMWTANGNAVCAQDSAQFVQTMIPDGLGGAIIGWDDERGAGQDEDIYAQSISPTGTLRWPTAGIRIATGSGTRALKTSAPDGYGGALFAWEDFRSGVNNDVYAFRITSIGTGVDFGASPRAPTGLLPARPNPFNPSTALEFELAASSTFRLAIHDVRGRLVRVIASGSAPAGRSTYRWDGLTETGSDAGSGVYYAVLTLPTGRRSTAITLVR